MDRNTENNFFPYSLFEIVLVAAFAVEVVLVLAALFPPSMGREIDFSAQYSPRPEWYFLFLYQLTKYFPGSWTFVGAVLLPGLAFGALLSAPFLDRSGSNRLRERKLPVIIGFGLFAIIVALTLRALV